METLMQVAIVWAFWWAIFKFKAFCYRIKMRRYKETPETSEETEGR